jgi:uncharacterized protein (TIGR02271 family)
MSNEAQAWLGHDVYGADGSKIGKVIDVRGEEVLLEKGLFFPKDFLIPISEIRQDGSRLATSRAASSYREGGAATASSAAPRSTPAPTSVGSMGRTDVRVPVVEEQVEARTVSRQAGEVRVHKTVVTEQKQISVPVMHEEVRVERVATQAGRTAVPGEATFQGADIRVPLIEEQVEIVKKPVIKEEVVISRTPRMVEQRAETTVRHEEVEVEGEQRKSAFDDDDVHQAGTSWKEDDDGKLV